MHAQRVLKRGDAPCICTATTNGTREGSALAISR